MRAKAACRCRTVGASLAALIALQGCDETPTTVRQPVDIVTAGGLPVLAEMRGTVHEDGTVTVEHVSSAASPSSGAGFKVYGNQNQYAVLSGTLNDITTAGATKTWTLTFSLQNIRGGPIGDEESAPPAATHSRIGIFLFIAPNSHTTLVRARGEKTIDQSATRYVYYPEVLANGATTSTTQVWQFQTPASATSFTFNALASAPWPTAPDADSRFKVTYLASADSVPDQTRSTTWPGVTGSLTTSVAEPQWLRESFSVDNGGTASLTVDPAVHENNYLTTAGNAGILTLGNGSIVFSRSDRLAPGDAAWVEALVRLVPTNTSTPDAGFFLNDGRMIGVGVSSTQAGFISWGNNAWSFISGTTFNLGASPHPGGFHRLRLSKLADGTVTLYLDDVQKVSRQRDDASFDTDPGYTGTVLFGSQANGALLQPGSAARWNRVMYEIGAATPAP